MSQVIPHRGVPVRYLIVALAALQLLAVADVLCSANGSVVGDLQLVSWKSLPDGSVSWSGPVAAATIMSWFAAHGYPQLLPDLNDDGFVDETDTAALANVLGRGLTEGETPMHGADAALVGAITAYLSEVAGGQFRVRVYDASLEQEWRAVPGRWAWPEEAQGIDFAVLGDPLLTDYQSAMASGALAVLGITGSEPTSNVYFAGRSFADGSTDDVTLEIGLVSSEDDRCRIGETGQVIDTLTSSVSPWRVLIDSRWAEVEFLLTLEPVAPGPVSEMHRAPDLVVTVEATVLCGGTDPGAKNETDCSVSLRTEIVNARPSFRVPRPFKVEQRVRFGADRDGSPIYQFLPVYVEGDRLRDLNQTGQVSVETQFEWLADSTKNPQGEYEVEVRVDARCEIDESALVSELNNLSAVHVRRSVPDGTSESGEPPAGEATGDEGTDSDAKGNNGIGNGVDPQPPGNPPVNDDGGSSPGGGKGKGKGKNPKATPPYAADQAFSMRLVSSAPWNDLSQ